MSITREVKLHFTLIFNQGIDSGQNWTREEVDRLENSGIEKKWIREDVD